VMAYLSTVLTAASSTLPITSVQFASDPNAQVDMAGLVGQMGPLTIQLPSASFAPTFYVRRSVAGASVMRPFTIVDGCGLWQTFVGGGAGGFEPPTARLRVCAHRTKLAGGADKAPRRVSGRV
jgi:hypothetical protein